MTIVKNVSYLIARCGPSPRLRGVLIGKPRAAPALNDIRAIHDTDKYEGQPLVILELLEMTREPRIDPGRQLPPH